MITEKPTWHIDFSRTRVLTGWQCNPTRMGRACTGIEGHRVVWIIARNRQPWHRFKWLRQIQTQVPSNGLGSNSNLPGKSLPYMWILDDFTCPVSANQASNQF